MPLYDYKCLLCERQEERVVPLGDFDTVQRCPCGHLMVKVITAPAFNLKGPSAGSKPRQSIR